MSGRRSARLRNQPPTPALSNDELARLERSGNRARREAAAANRAISAAAPVPAAAAAQTAPNESAPIAQHTQGDSNIDGSGENVSFTAQAGPAITESPVPEHTETSAAKPTGSDAPNPLAEPQPSDSNEASAPTQGTTGQSPEHASDSCDDLERLLRELKDQALAAEAAQPTDPPAIGYSLDDNTVARAVAAVTEAISNNSTGSGSTQFTLVDPTTLRERREYHEFQQAVDTVQQVARPGNEALLVRLNGRHRAHYSLLFLRRAGDDRFEFRSYDSARGNYHRLDLQSVANEFRDHLHDLGWARANPDAEISNRAITSDPLARQIEGWECGVYAIVYAWALALGLDISSFLGLHGERATQFCARAVDLILLSLQGHCSSALIEAFLKCFGVVPNDAMVPDGRQFDRTTPFLDESALRTHIARLRLRGGLPDGLPPLEDVLERIRAANPDFGRDLWTITHDSVVLEWATAASLADASPPKNTSSGATSGNPSNGASGIIQTNGSIGASSDPQKPENNGPAGSNSGNSGQQTGNSAPKGDPCARLAENLNVWQTMHDSNERTDNLISGVEAQTQLPDETVHRAIASVTEALSETTNGPRFSLLSLISIRLPVNSAERQRIARPGNPALIPHTERGHTSLFHLEQPAPGQQFTLRHYDSAEVGHTRMLSQRAARIRQHLLSLRWTHNNAESIEPRAAIPRSNLTRQSHGWECGMHAIFYAWAIALGLRIDGSGWPAPADRFLEDGTRIINFALLGRVDSATILAFLQCYGLVARTQTVLDERTFNRTVPFPEQTALERRIARLRVQEDLDELRRTDPSVPTIDLLEHMFTDAGDVFLTRDGRGVLDHYREFLLTDPRTPPAGGNAINDTSPGMARALAQIAELNHEARTDIDDISPNMQRDLARIAELQRQTLAGSETPGAGRASTSTPRPSPGASSKTAYDATTPGGAPTDENSPSRSDELSEPAAPVGDPAATLIAAFGSSSPWSPNLDQETTHPLDDSTPPTEESSNDSMLTLFQTAINNAGVGPAAPPTTMAATGRADSLDAEAQSASPRICPIEQSATDTRSEPPFSDLSPSLIRTRGTPQAPIIPNEPAQRSSVEPESSLRYNEDDTLFGEGGGEDGNDDEQINITEAPPRTRPPLKPLTIDAPPRYPPGLALPPPTPRNTAPPLNQTAQPDVLVEEGEDSTLPPVNPDDTLFGERDLQQSIREASSPAGDDSTLPPYNEDDTLFGERDLQQPATTQAAPRRALPPIRPLSIVPPLRTPTLALPPPTPRNTAPPLDGGPRGILAPLGSAGQTQPSQTGAGPSAAGDDAATELSRKRSLDDDGSSDQPAKRTRRNSIGDAEQ